MFCTRVAWVCFVCLTLCKDKGDYVITERRDMGLYEVIQLPYVWYYVGVKSSFNMLVRNASPRGPMCFRCLMFSLSGPDELLFLLCFIASWT